jgi:curved DNA-binding protein CbpA
MLLDSRNYYDVLEVQPGCTDAEIKLSYTRARNAYSGDSVALYSLMSNDECEKMLDLIEEAFSILSVPNKRREYDKVRGLKQLDIPEQDSNLTMQEKLQLAAKNSQQAQSTPVRNITDDLMNETLSSASTNREESFEYNTSTAAQNQNSNHSYVSIKKNVDIPKVSAFKQFSLDYTPSPEFDVEIENCTEFTGAFLQKIREYKDVSIERMAEMTRISKTYIRNIEADHFENLPAIVYTRGFVFQIAKCLKLNPELVANSYIHLLKQAKNG